MLEGVCRAGGAAGVRMIVRLSPDGPEAVYAAGRVGRSSDLVLHLGQGSVYRATVELHGASSGPTVVQALLPLLEVALLALIERCNASQQVEVLSQVLGAATDPALLMDLSGDILWANHHGDELLALHTEQPRALLDGAAEPAPLLHLVVEQMAMLQKSGDKVRHQVVTTGDGGRWRLEILAVPGLGNLGCCLVILSPVQLPSPKELASRFEPFQVSYREAEVLAHVLRGQKAAEIAAQLRLSEYTVKDHLKHAYAKLGISSRGQLLSRIATATGLGT
jgi:DNA-binding CsgD family transcriptional regulator